MFRSKLDCIVMGVLKCFEIAHNIQQSSQLYIITSGVRSLFNRKRIKLKRAVTWKESHNLIRDKGLSCCHFTEKAIGQSGCVIMPLVSNNNFADRQLESVIYSRKICVFSRVESRWKIINQFLLCFYVHTSACSRLDCDWCRGIDIICEIRLMRLKISAVLIYIPSFNDAITFA